MLTRSSTLDARKITHRSRYMRSTEGGHGQELQDSVVSRENAHLTQERQFHALCLVGSLMVWLMVTVRFRNKSDISCLKNQPDALSFPVQYTQLSLGQAIKLQL